MKKEMKHTHRISIYIYTSIHIPRTGLTRTTIEGSELRGCRNGSRDNHEACEAQNDARIFGTDLLQCGRLDGCSDRLEGKWGENPEA